MLFQLFYTFFLIGLFSFGGGMGMMALIEQEVVINNNWMTSTELYRFIGISESTPGPIAVNIATFVGCEKGGAAGGLAATLGVCLPSFLIILLIATLLKTLMKNPCVKACLNGVKPVVLGLLFAMAVKIIAVNMFGAFTVSSSFTFAWQPLLITVLLFCVCAVYPAIFKKRLPPILLILLSIGMGILVYA